ncbi:hypothetical protein M0R45_037804 [Rubus argutus]|uniref:Uncharacterized protein n=1 Tax=Rubus argutus TaxID=59490 RepID=A0AAW1W5H5_RUBAR
MGQGPSKAIGLTRSQRQDELVKICPLPARVIRRPKTNADGSEIESIPNCDFEFPDANCEEWIKMMYESHQAMSGSENLAAAYQDIVKHCCGIEVDLQASENVSAKLPTNSVQQ